MKRADAVEVEVEKISREEYRFAKWLSWILTNLGILSSCSFCFC